MSDRLSVAVIGCGWAGTRHAQALMESGFAVRWAVDTNQARAASLACGCGAQVADDYRRAIEDAALDAVSICLPHSLHAPVAIAALQAGKHVLVEKPLAATLEEADAMIAAAEASGVVLMVAENVRYEPLYRRAQALLEEGAIGEPALIQMTRECYLTRSFLEERRWFLNREAAAGGIMMSGGIHDFETMRMLLGEIASVQALRAPQRFMEMEGDDTSVALVRFRSGVVGTLVESFVMKSLTTASGPEVHSLRIDGTLGSLVAPGGRVIQLYSEQAGWRHGEHLVQHDIHVPPEDTFKALIDDLAVAVRTGREPLTSGRAQRRPLEVVLAAYRSMEVGGQPIALD